LEVAQAKTFDKCRSLIILEKKNKNLPKKKSKTSVKQKLTIKSWKLKYVTSDNRAFIIYLYIQISKHPN